MSTAAATSPNASSSSPRSSSTSPPDGCTVPLTLSLLRQLKNLVIGNPTKKRELLANQSVLEALILTIHAPSSSCASSSAPLSFASYDDSGDSEALPRRIQATIIIGSLAMWHDPLTWTLSQRNAASAILSCLDLPSLPLLEASTRALKAIFSNPHLSKSELLRKKSLLKVLSLLDRSLATAPKVAEACAFILAKACDHEGIQDLVASFQPLPSFLKLLAHPHTTGAGLQVLSAFCRDHPDNGKLIIQSETVNHRPLLSELLSYIRDKRLLVRLYAVTCLSHLFRARFLDDLPEPIHFHLMPCLTKLFDAPYPVNKNACLVFASLVQDSEEMQQLASDMETIPKLASMLRQSPTDALCEAVLLAMASVSALHEPCRKLLLQLQLLQVIVAKLHHPHRGIRSAACQCLRSISRSVKNLRSTLLDAGVVDPLFELLSDDAINVLVPASAVLCNLVLDFAPMKQTFIEKGGMQRLASLVTSCDSQLRLNSIWAFKNLAYNAPSSTKHQLIQTLSFDQLIDLVNDPDIGLQEQALNLLRNLVCGTEEDVDFICQGLGAHAFIHLIFTKLHSENVFEIIHQALCVIVNVAAGGEQHKSMIMQHEALLKRIFDLLNDPHPHIRVAVVWILINLTWPDDPHSSLRIQALREMGFEQGLQQLKKDTDVDVRDRVKAALLQFNDAS